MEAGMVRLSILVSMVFVGAATMAGPSFAHDAQGLRPVEALARLGKSGSAGGGTWREAAGGASCLCAIPPNTPESDSNGACLERDWCEQRFKGRCGPPCH